MNSAAHPYEEPPTSASVRQSLLDGMDPTSIPPGERKRCLAVLAIDIGDDATVAALVASGLPINRTGLPGTRDDEPLLVRQVLTEPRIRSMELLLGAGADASLSSRRERSTPLHALVKGARRVDCAALPTIIDLLLRHGGSLNARNAWGRTPLHLAAVDGTTTLVRALLARGADPHALDQMGATPWQSTSIWNKHDQAVALLESGAVPRFDPHSDRHRLICASQLDEIAAKPGGMPPHLVDWLVSQMADPEQATWAIERLQHLASSGSTIPPQRSPN